MSSSEPGPEILDAATDGTVATTDPRHRAAALVGGLAVVVLLLWLLARSPDGGALPDGAEDPAPTAAPAATPRTTVVRAPTAPTTLFAPDRVARDRPTGLWLFYGGGDPLQRLDLDTGVHDLYGVRAHPVLAVADQLVLATDGGEIGWVDLAQPGGQANGWSRAKIAPGDEPGALWLQRPVDGARWIRLEPSTGLVLERSRRVDGDVTETGLDGRAGVLVPGPDLVDTANGIYRFDGGGTTARVGTGRIVTYDTTRVLVERCGDRLDDCALTWHDRANWTPLDLPAPIASGLIFAEILGGGRWLHLVDDGGARLVDLASTGGGAEIPLTRSEAGLAMSPDGRWIAVGSPQVDVIDLATREVVVSIELERVRGGTLLLVDKAAAG